MAGVIVETVQGKIRGVTNKDANNRQYFSFLGIPYAKPPVGKLRFRAPVPLDPWGGILDATQPGEQSCSFDTFKSQFVGSENCLNLNVDTPQLPKSKNDNLLPVMIWIHGGGFTNGSSIEFYSPHYLITEDVVIVSINYRLGVFGFLCLEDTSLGVPGNAAMKDMVLALKWVQQNISRFGGDPNNVTLFGESAGGAAVHYLILSPMAKDLFHKAIAQSGSSLNPWTVGKKGAKHIMKALAKPEIVDEKEILKYLQSLSSNELLEATVILYKHINPSRTRPFGPIVETVSKFESNFLSEEPIDIISSGKFNQVPLITGFTTNEGMVMHFMTDNITEHDTFVDLENDVPHWLGYSHGTQKIKEVAQKLQQYYFDNEKPSSEDLSKLYTMLSDILFVYGIFVSAKYQAGVSPNPVYLYQMSIESSLNIIKKYFKITASGVAHADDLGYLFKNELTPEIKPGSLEYLSVLRFVKLWTNFAKFGNPTPESDDFLKVTWKPFDARSLNYLDIGENLTLKSNPFPNRMSFWREICKNSPSGSKFV